MRLVQAHVVHHFVMISYLVIALVCQMRGGNIHIFMTCRIHSGNLTWQAKDIALKSICDIGGKATEYMVHISQSIVVTLIQFMVSR